MRLPTRCSEAGSPESAHDELVAGLSVTVLALELCRGQFKFKTFLSRLDTLTDRAMATHRITC